MINVRGIPCVNGMMTAWTARYTALARAVDEALTMEDARVAAAFLADCGAEFALICRVLAEPARRRKHNVAGQTRQAGTRNIL